MSDDSSDDKQFEATQKKLDDARKKGEIGKSADVTTAASYGGLMIAFVSMGSASLLGLASILTVLVADADALSDLFFSGNPTVPFGGVMWSVAFYTSPWFVLPALAALLSLATQRSIIFAPDKIAPKLSRISIISGFKNKFGRQGLFEFLKSFFKLLIYCVILGAYLKGASDRIVGTIYLSPNFILVELGRMITTLLLIVLAVSGVIGIVDYIWQLAEHQRKNRMSRKEMTDEMKQSDGDPALKQKRRQKGIEIAMNQMLADVPGADVIIVNPTHFAVALKWDRSSLGAPVCVAKGADEVAAKIRELAQEHTIPIHSDPPTARVLFATVDIGQEIAPEHYASVAAAIRFAEAVAKKAKKT